MSSSSSHPELFVEGLGFGEGPRWHDGRLWYSDFLYHRVSSSDPAGRTRSEVQIDDQPSGLGWLPDGTLLVVSMRRRQLLRREQDGSTAVHADLSGVATFHANDMVVADDGTAYVGNLGSDLLAGEPLQGSYLAIVRPDGSVSAGDEVLFVPNGSVITPAGDLLIVGESHSRRYVAFPIRPGGDLGKGRVWAELGERAPDGCTLDAEGAIWFADVAHRAVARVLEGGEITHVIEMPETAWACALGGSDGRSLFVITCPEPPTADLEPGRGKIWTVGVDVPHAGRP